MTRRAVFTALLGLALAGALPARAQAGGYTVYYFNMAQLNYRYPVPYTRIYRAGLTNSVYTTWDSCMQAIRSSVSWNKRNGYDFEAFLIVYTDRYPTNPYNRTGTLADVNAGSFGRWGGWWVYRVDVRGRGYYYNPANYFKRY